MFYGIKGLTGSLQEKIDTALENIAVGLGMNIADK